MGSYDESYDYETLTENTADIRKLKNSDDHDKSFLANIAISGHENDKIRNTYRAEEFDFHATKSTRDVKDNDAYSIKNFPNYLDAIETYIENAKSAVWWNPIYHNKISGLLDDFRRLRISEWSEFERRKANGNNLTYLAEAHMHRVELLDKYEIKVRQTIDSMVNGFTFKELAKKVGSSLTPQLMKKIGRKAMKLFSQNKESAFEQKMKDMDGEKLAKLNKQLFDDEEEEFSNALSKSEDNETPEKSKRANEALSFLASTLRPSSSCEKDYNMMSSLSKKFTEDYYDESSSSSNATDFDKLEFRKDTTSNKLLQRMLALLFVFAKYDLKDKSDIQKVFNPPENEENFFDIDNGVWNKNTFKFGKSGEGIDHYLTSIDEIINDTQNPITKVYEEFKTKIFSDSFAGLDRDKSKTFFANFCGNMTSSKMQEVYTELMKPELSYKNISPVFGDRFKKRDNGKQK